jgi:hypothetical protein
LWGERRNYDCFGCRAPPSLFIRKAQSFVGIQRIEHARDDIGTIEAISKAGDRVEVRSSILAFVDVPADKFVGSCGSIVIALWRPGNPAPAI